MRLGSTSGFPAVAMPPLPLAPISASGGSDVTVAPGQVVALQPGNYKNLTDDGTLLLNPGSYAFSQVMLGNSAKLVAIAGGVQMSIGGSFTAGRYVNIYPAFGMTADQFSIAVSGPDQDGTPAASVGEHGVVKVLLAAPHGTLAFADHVRAAGAFVGFDIALGDDIDLTFQTGFPSAAQDQHGQQQLSGYFSVPANPGVTPLAGPVPPTVTVPLAIGLPLRDPAGAQSLAAAVSDPKNPKFRQYLSVNQFAATYGATAGDYQALVQWAQSAGLTITSIHQNSILLSVSGTAAQIERALYTNLVYRRRADGSTFVTVDREPSLDLGVAILRISGLNEVVAPHPSLRAVPRADRADNVAAPDPGSGPGGIFDGNDFRTAYVPGIAELGNGQTVALVEFDGFFPNDITSYENQFSLPNTPIQTQRLDGFNGNPSSNNTEISLDIEAAVSMAPNVDAIIAYEGILGNSILGAIASPPNGVPLSKQASSSWNFSVDSNTVTLVTEMALQGFSGDRGFRGILRRPWRQSGPAIHDPGGRNRAGDEWQWRFLQLGNRLVGKQRWDSNKCIASTLPERDRYRCKRRLDTVSQCAGCLGHRDRFWDIRKQHRRDTERKRHEHCHPGVGCLYRPGE